MTSSEIMVMLVRVLTVATMAAVTEAQQSPGKSFPVTPSPPTSQVTSSPCGNAYTALLPCMAYVSGANSTVMPACCNAFLAVVVNNAATCLCQFLSSQNPLGIVVNTSQSVSLPSACNINTPPLSTQCAAIGVPLTPSSQSPPASGLPLKPPLTAAAPGTLPALAPASPEGVPPLGSPVSVGGLPFGSPPSPPADDMGDVGSPMESPAPFFEGSGSGSPLPAPGPAGQTNVVGSGTDANGDNGSGSSASDASARISVVPFHGRVAVLLGFLCLFL